MAHFCGSTQSWIGVLSRILLLGGGKRQQERLPESSPVLPSPYYQLPRDCTRLRSKYKYKMILEGWHLIPTKPMRGTEFCVTVMNGRLYLRVKTTQ